MKKISHEAANSQGKILVCHQLQLVVGDSGTELSAGFSRAFQVFEKPG
jgi:hypothetical protein